jgi:hypothetical protein
MLKFAIIRLESKQWEKIAWGKRSFPFHAVIQVSNFMGIRDATPGIIGTVVGKVDVSGQASDALAYCKAWARFHRDACNCRKTYKTWDRCYCATPHNTLTVTGEYQGHCSVVKVQDIEAMGNGYRIR